MKNLLKSILKQILFHLHIDLTRNQHYDRQTLQIMKMVLSTDSQCIDVGCHKGEMLDNILKFSEKGPHWAFEPIPSLYKFLTDKYKGINVNILPYALSNEKNKVTFQHVLNDPAFSGLKRRKYHCNHPNIEEIEVETERLDNIISSTYIIRLIKIDVEGGEYGVLQGAMKLLSRDKPFVIFEFGLGAADYYHIKPDMMYDLFRSCGLRISLMKDYLNHRDSLSKEAFCNEYSSDRNYYFLAHP